jgi:outer membrane scaffolding protein for murein synthesis (MipA/OmpV family)
MHQPFNMFNSAASAALSVTASLVPFNQAAADTPAEQPASGGILGNHTDIVVGLGAGIDQRYMGASDFRPLVQPVFNISRGVFFLDSVRGAGVQYQSASGFYVAEALNYDLGRADKNSFFQPGSDHLRRLGEVKGTVTNVLTLAQQLTPWLQVNAQAEFGLDNGRGNQYQAGLESVVLKTPHDSITLDLDAKWGDGQYNRTYFGVTTAQSRSSGFARFEPGSGLYAGVLAGTWSHTFDKHWSAQLVLGGAFYLDKVADGPIVQQRVGITVFPSVSYTF